ncbi:MAG: GNAT family N-acetyltransferase [Methanobacteriota archaeon]|nr:MAG: GNAT family N-acetyltransferase [Euryarchaeota archaeon]
MRRCVSRSRWTGYVEKCALSASALHTPLPAIGTIVGGCMPLLPPRNTLQFEEAYQQRWGEGVQTFTHTWTVRARRRGSSEVDTEDELEVIAGVELDTFWGGGCLSRIAVAPSHRGRGIASALLRLALHRAAAVRGVRALHADAYTYQSVPFLEKHGFRETWRRTEGLPSGHALLYLRRAGVDDDADDAAAGEALAALQSEFDVTDVDRVPPALEAFFTAVYDAQVLEKTGVPDCARSWMYEAVILPSSAAEALADGAAPTTVGALSAASASHATAAAGMPSASAAGSAASSSIAAARAVYMLCHLQPSLLAIQVVVKSIAAVRRAASRRAPTHTYSRAFRRTTAPGSQTFRPTQRGSPHAHRPPVLRAASASQCQPRAESLGVQ